MDGNEKWITTASVTAIIVGLIIGLILGYWWGGSTKVEDMHDHDHDEVMVENTNEDGSDEMPSKASNNYTGSAVASDQEAGAMVLVDSASLGQSSWLAVRELVDGVPMGILGAKRLEAGEHLNVSVTLLRPTVNGMTYQIDVFADDGDGEFESRTDTIVSSSNTFMVDGVEIMEEKEEM